MTAASDDRTRLAIAGIVLALTLPFSAKPFHIDDVYFIEVAQNVQRDPLRPLAGAVALEDEDYRVFTAQGHCPSTFTSMSHPPLVPYVIALAAWAARGFTERVLHLAFVPFALAAGLAMHSLSRRFTRHPRAATLLLLTSPVFVLSSHSLMTDMPALAFSSAALALFVRGLDEDRRRWIVFSGLLAGLAVLTRYSTALTPLLMLAYGATRGRARRTLPALAAAALVTAVWMAQNLLVEGRLHLLASTEHYRLFYEGQSFDGAGLVKKTLSDMSGLGGTAFAAAGLLLLAGTWRRAVTFAAAALAAAAVFVVKPPSIDRLAAYSSTDVSVVAGFFALGAVLVVEALWPAPDGGPMVDEGAAPDTDRAGRMDHGFLVLWLVSALATALFLLPFGTARYLLPALPPLWLLLVRRADAILGAGTALRLTFGLAVAQGAALSVILGLADMELARGYREVARSVRASHPDRTIWFVGEWGFRFYMNTVGGRYLRSTDERPEEGDIIVRPGIAGMHVISDGVEERSVRLQQISLPGRWPVRLMSFDAKAGYYSHHWGYLPWRYAHYPLETIDIFQVRAPAPAAPAETCASS
ncbi:MAG TPA: glycosyltransferase family 39 protein [Vicinamibacteria bacterium]|nr:glycosyltransferase family 39 protein [Vicinamibacteria bacterium]